MNISVYITSYNKSKYLTKAIESVLNQSYKPFEIIIVDDYSTDKSREIISSFYKRYPNIIIPIYNELQYIYKTLESINLQKQSLLNNCLVVLVINNSKRSSQKIIQNN